MNGKYMAYVGSYSYTGKAKGITVYDVDVEKGVFKERCEVEVDNSSYVIASSDGKTLYSIADEGVVSFRILQNGSLARLNSSPIRGMRGCHLCTDVKDEYVFVSAAQNAPYIKFMHLHTLVSTPSDLAATWSSRIAIQARPTLDFNTLPVTNRNTTPMIRKIK